MRHRYVSALYKEFVGPRSGAEEVLLADPKSEYLCGQLNPIESDGVETEIQTQSLGEFVGVSSAEDNDDPPNMVDQALIDAGKQFRSIPSSFGVSFAVQKLPRQNELKLCFTWARYKSEQNTWKRMPSIWMIDAPCTPGSHEVINPNKTVKAHIEIHQSASSHWKISIFLLSTVDLDDRKRVKTEDIIFQPEIRISLPADITLVALGESGFVALDDEWRIATRQYDKLSVHARGHLCGAYWAAIDPQRPVPTGVTASAEPPFRWVDGEHFKKAANIPEYFFSPTIRTDFIPLYPAPNPPSAKDGQISVAAEVIANIKNKADLKKYLQSVTSAYNQWILNQPRTEDTVIQEILSSHRNALERIEEGINFVTTNDAAFRAFLFMNQAMNMQYGWDRLRPGRKLEWRPFQIAFILFSLKSSVERDDSNRDVCDTIWFPTGGGKTEAYLGLSCFVMAFRRITSKSDNEGFKCGEGISVLSRYTLRLLTIQQFRRALRMVTACELLRCRETAMENNWGRSQFSIGLWVGSGVTPNQMRGTAFRNNPGGAVEQLRFLPGKDSQNEAAQVLNCPCCDSILSLPPEGLQKGKVTFHFIGIGRPIVRPEYSAELSNETIVVNAIDIKPHPSGKIFYGKIDLDLLDGLKTNSFAKWFEERFLDKVGFKTISFNHARPGYFPIYEGKSKKPTGYEIRCANSTCELNTLVFKQKRPYSNGQWAWASQHELFCNDRHQALSLGIPIPAITVDEEIYHNPPSMLISTCDKIVWTAYTEDSASLFGRIRSYDSAAAKGFSQRPLSDSSRLLPCESFAPPDLVIQDELHLLEGPLGSNFGIFETIVDVLASKPKYIASSATIRKSTDQIKCLLGRRTSIFPPPNPDVGEGFFLRLNEIHPLDERGTGRLFLGLAFPGRAPQTPTVRTWGSLLQTSQDLLDEGVTKPEIDPYWTVVGYFNAVRELAQAETYWRQDISGFINYAYDRKDRQGTKRNIVEPQFANLSSQTDSSDLPGILSRMEREIIEDGCFDGVLTTSMFGTGVDVSRLSAMIVHGQPKASSQYIQAVGRIGRSKPGLAVNLFRVSKPRDLNHYEYFTGYHRRLPVAVEPITVRPLSSKALKRMLGPIIVSLIRNWNDPLLQISSDFSTDDGACRGHEIPKRVWDKLLDVMEKRWEDQPTLRRYLAKNEFRDFVQSHIERWTTEAKRSSEVGAELRYRKGNNVVLGSSRGGESIFADAPVSLRDVEPLLNIYTRTE